jgi:hypothetical protein
MLLNCVLVYWCCAILVQGFRGVKQHDSVVWKTHMLWDHQCHKRSNHANGGYYQLRWPNGTFSLLLLIMLMPVNWIGLRNEEPYWYSMIAATLLLLLSWLMLMPVNWIGLRNEEPYWYSMTAATLLSLLLWLMLIPVNWIGLRNEEPYWYSMIAATLLLLLSLIMLMPVNWIGLRNEEPYWYSMTAAMFAHNLLWITFQESDSHTTYSMVDLLTCSDQVSRWCGIFLLKCCGWSTGAVYSYWGAVIGWMVRYILMEGLQLVRWYGTFL